MITLQTIERASALIKDYITRTPLIRSQTLSRMFDANVYLKLENLQRTGSFKIRGALHKLIRTMETSTEAPSAVVAASAGNHAQGVAVAARIVGLPVTIIMPRLSSISKQEAVRNYGAQLIIHGASVEESLEKAEELASRGMILVHPFDDPEIIAGQATVGLEIAADLPHADTVVIPVGGGGLIAGTSLALKPLRPDTRIIGVQAAACPSAYTSLQAGKRVKVPMVQTLADGISVRQPGVLPFQTMQDNVDRIITVEETHIAEALLMLLERKNILAEGAGAVPLAALLSGALIPEKNENIVLLISGGNVDTPLLGRIVHHGLVKNGRIARIKIRMDDKPGVLAALLQQVARLEANILHIHHDREDGHAPIYEARVELTLETRSHEHIREILQTINRCGYEAVLIGDDGK